MVCLKSIFDAVKRLNMTDQTNHLPIDSEQIPWSHRLTIIRACDLDLSKPQVVQKVCDVFNIQPDHVDALQNMEASGDWTIDPEFDTSPYVHHFAGANDLPALAIPSAEAVAQPTPSQQPAVARPSAKPAMKKDPTAQPPASASRTPRAPKKRGRKGSKIQKAFQAVPAEPTDAEAFAKKHQVSMAVLRQSKRFDKDGVGAVRVKQNDDKVLMIWREMPEADTEATPTATAVAGEGTTTETTPTTTQTVVAGEAQAEAPAPETAPATAETSGSGDEAGSAENAVA
jgi:hypothetical protein